MTIISSHVLDSVTGSPAKYIRIECVQLLADGGRKGLFNTVADDQGGIHETIVAPADNQTRYELIFHSAEYFYSQPGPPPPDQIMPEVVVRFLISGNKEKVHIPVMLSPHSYSTWWSV